LPPNLLSLSRMVMAPLIVWIIWLDSPGTTWFSVVLLVVAGITDFLDGYLARKMDQITPAGLILDPIADKTLALALILALTLFRDFPSWLAILVVARDVIILAAGLGLKKARKVEPVSKTAGKFYFSSLLVLLGCHLFQFTFGQTLFLYVTLLFFVLSSVEYLVLFVRAVGGGEESALFDHRAARTSFMVIILIASAVGLIGLVRFFWLD